MNINENLPFLHTIYQLRKQEKIVLYSKWVVTEFEERTLVRDFLEEEYELEKSDYPFVAPPFNSEAALWGATTLHMFAQAVVYRKHHLEELQKIILPFSEAITPSAMLSADLCLRFLPQIKEVIKNIDPDDPVADMIQEYLQTWHYSGIGTDLNYEQLDNSIVIKDPCFSQLYIDRIVFRKDTNLAVAPQWKLSIVGLLGLYGDEFWKEIKPVII